MNDLIEMFRHWTVVDYLLVPLAFSPLVWALSVKQKMQNDVELMRLRKHLATREGREG